MGFDLGLEDGSFFFLFGFGFVLLVKSHFYFGGKLYRPIKESKFKFRVKLSLFVNYSMFLSAKRVK